MSNSDFFQFYRTVFCSFNFSFLHEPDEVISNVCALYQNQSDVLSDGIKHIDIDSFPDVYVPALHTESTSIPTCSSSTNPKTKISKKTVQDDSYGSSSDSQGSSSTFLFSIDRSTGRITGTDLVKIADTFSSFSDHPGGIRIYDLHNIEKDIIAMCSKRSNIDVYTEIDHIGPRCHRLKNFFCIFNQLVCFFIHIGISFQDSAYLFEDATYFLESDGFHFSFSQSKFMLECFFFMYSSLSNFNRKMDDQLKVYPVDSNAFINDIDAMINEYSFYLGQSTHCIFWFLSNPVLIDKYFLYPHKHTQHVTGEFKTVTFDTLCDFLKKNVEHEHLNDDVIATLQKMDHDLMECIFILDRYCLV